MSIFDRSQEVPDYRSSEPEPNRGLDDVEAYQNDDELVIYDAADPIVWIQCDRPVDLEVWR